MEGTDGKIFVIHNPSGGRIGCGVLALVDSGSFNFTFGLLGIISLLILKLK